MLKMTPFGAAYCILLVGVVVLLASRIPWLAVGITFLLIVIIAVCWSLISASQQKARMRQAAIAARTDGGSFITTELVAEVKRQLSEKKKIPVIAEALKISPATVKRIKTGSYDGIANWPQY
jgi:hypothetical protein